jgi:hypothetical protein
MVWQSSVWGLGLGLDRVGGEGPGARALCVVVSRRAEAVRVIHVEVVSGNNLEYHG